MKIPIKVNAYAGYKAEERPVSFEVGGHTHMVEEVLDKWYGEGHDYFKLKADDGYLYVLSYDREMDEWELTMMEKKE